MNDNGVVVAFIILLFFTGVFIGGATGCTYSYVAYNESICIQLYSKTKDYKDCKLKPIDENFKLIRSICNDR